MPGAIAAYSFLSRGAYGGVERHTLEDYENYTTADPLYAEKFSFARRGFSLILTGHAALEFLLALFIARAELAENLYLALVILPFWTSFLIRLYAWMFLLRDTGLVDTILIRWIVIHEPLRLLYNEGDVILGLIYGYLPFAVLPLYATLERQDATLLDAAADLGATPWRALWRVTIPLAMPGIWAASILVFIPCLGTYIVSDLLGGSKTVLIGNLVQNQWSAVSRDSTLEAAASMLLMLLIQSAASHAALAGGTVVKRALPTYAAFAYLFLHLPLVILAIFSVNRSRFTVWDGLSLRWYRAMFADHDLLASAGNSLLIAMASTVLATIIGTLAAYAKVMKERKTRPWHGRLRSIYRW